MPLDALIFDLDGTLVDTNDAHVESWVRGFARHGYKVTADRIRPEVGKGGDNLVPAILGEEAERRDGDALRDATQQEFLRLAAERRFRVFDGTLALLDALRARGIRTALATSSGEENLVAIFRSAGLGDVERGPLRDRLDALVSKSDVERSKPDPDVVAAAVRKLGLAPTQCAMVGDTPHDAASARAAGVVTLGVLAGGMNDARALLAAGARGTWRDPAHLLAELDEALRVAAPARARLTADALDALMREALAAAAEALERGDVPLGCAVADGDGRVVARAHDETRSSGSRVAHADVLALARAAGRVPADARDLALATTVEPCVMCTGAAMEAAVDTVVFGLHAPAGGGVGRVAPAESAESQVPRVVGGVLAGECRALLERWHAAHADDPRAAYVAQLIGRGPQGGPAAPDRGGAGGAGGADRAA